MAHMSYQRPFLKWAGGKYTSLSRILHRLPEAKRFIEPFAGSGVVFINTEYPNYLIGEANADIIGIFQSLQQEGDGFIDYCETFFCSQNNTALQYYAFREQFNEATDPKLRAALFLYLNRHGFNGLCRYNSKGIYNVPFGSYAKPFFPRDNMQYFYQKSQDVIFKHADFTELFNIATPGDIIYCDPPYVPLPHQISNFSTYTAHPFDENQQVILAKISMQAAKRGITVIISNHDTAFTRHHYQHSEIHAFEVARVISSKTAQRDPAKELLAIFHPEYT
jgi:DNA adenine methylase